MFSTMIAYEREESSDEVLVIRNVRNRNEFIVVMEDESIVGGKSVCFEL